MECFQNPLNSFLLLSFLQTSKNTVWFGNVKIEPYTNHHPNRSCLISKRLKNWQSLFPAHLSFFSQLAGCLRLNHFLTADHAATRGQTWSLHRYKLFSQRVKKKGSWLRENQSWVVIRQEETSRSRNVGLKRFIFNWSAEQEEEFHTTVENRG